MNNLVCVYCRNKGESCAKEHVVPPAFGGNITLVDYVCSSCNEAFNKEFEHRFLKGSSTVSLFRGLKGLKGRREMPVYGINDHGAEIYVTVKENFPQVKCMIGKDKPFTPLQMILELEDGSFKYILNTENIRIQAKQLLNEMFSRVSAKDKVKSAYLWTDERNIYLAGYRALKKEFYIWLGEHGLNGEFYASTVNTLLVPVEWNTEDRNRMFSKIVLNFAFLLLNDREKCFLDNFDNIREFIRYGRHKDYDFIRQWTGYNPKMPFLEGIEFDLLVSIFEWREKVIGALYFPGIGLFLVDVGASLKLEKEFCKTMLFKNGAEPMHLTDRNSELFRNNVCTHPLFEKIFPELC